MPDLKSHFLLDPDIHFLNHGSFGSCPAEVFDAYHRWQAEVERQPVALLGRRADELLAESRAALAAYLGVAADDVIYFPNPTTAINMAARNLARADSPVRLRPGDEILTTDHEYGAMDRTWRYVCRHTGATYVQQPIPLPVTTHADFVERFWAGVTGRTRIIFLSHVTSPTALTFPVSEICRRARAAGLLTIVDGAHAPGQIPLNLAELGADLYTGACHKWLCAPKGAAFLYARRDLHAWLEPLVISWGWESGVPADAQFVTWHQWQGTRDIAVYLAVPAAIAFQAKHRWDAVRAACRALASATRQRVNALAGQSPICPDRPEWFTQFFAARLPDRTDLAALKRRLYDEYRVEAPTVCWNEQPFIRVSFQAYNDQADADALMEGLAALLPQVVAS